MNRVHIEFQRVQTWLFAVPRLRAMVGANTLLGETLRVRLPALAREQSNWALAPAVGNYPSAKAGDPLSSYDDPAADARDGILSRDGGHFEAIFASGAKEFAEAAAAMVRRELPGLRCRVSVDGKEIDRANADLSVELPVLAPCEWMGRGLGSVRIRQGTEQAIVSLEVSRRHEAAKRSQDGRASDLASLLAGTTRMSNLPAPGTFLDLAGPGYLALIHADGNDVGRGAAVGDDVHRTAFFHRNRVLLRRALRTAINEMCADEASAPLLPLMLGGDDLLVVARADTAMPFVVKLCEVLDELQRSGENDFRLTLGIGIVFARPTIPIHRLHEIAEWLAASSKRRFRGFANGEGRSVVDWAVYTTAWADDPEEARRRDWLRGVGQDVRVLSQRPVDVLGDGISSMKGLLLAAGRLEGAPRSQLRYLVEQLPMGRTLSELAFEELSKEARGALDGVGVRELWRRIPDGPLVTAVLDLVEVYEIGRLGRAGTYEAEPLPIEEDEEEPHGQE